MSTRPEPVSLSIHRSLIRTVFASSVIKSGASDCYGTEFLKKVIYSFFSGGIYAYFWAQKSIEEEEAGQALLRALCDLKDGETQKAIQFMGENYWLVNKQTDGRCDLELKTERGIVVHTFENKSIEALRQRSVLFSIYRNLSPEAKTAFLPLFDIQTTDNVDAHSLIASGDGDGSTARLVLLGIQAGIIRISWAGALLLAEVINAEAAVLKNLNRPRCDAILTTRFLTEFQKSETIQSKMQEMATHLTYSKGHTEFVSIGDCAHDRFSCNKDVDREIREKMHAQGAIFITGNHDVFYKKTNDTLYGGFAKDSADATEWMRHQHVVFSNAYYHQNTNTLYLHNGYERNRQDRSEIMTAFGAYIMKDQQFDPRAFVTEMNSRPLPIPVELVKRDSEQEQQNRNYFSHLTNFRPNEEAMKELAEEVGVRMVHGHTGNTNIDRHVVALNSRFKYAYFTYYTVTAARIGIYEEKTMWGKMWG